MRSPKGDVLDTLAGDPIEPDSDNPEAPEASGGDLFVCDHVGDDGICGASFGDANRLRMHKTGKHRDRSQDKAPGPRKATAKKTTTKRTADKAPSQAANKATGATTSRTATYASSLSMAALGAYLVVPAFDQYDLAVVNGGATNLADALDALGQQNETVRRTCDLILGGGSGGAYLQLLLAASAIAVPILAHHNVLPNSAGERFGAMIGMTPPPSPPAPAADEPHPSPTPEPGGDPKEWTADEVINLFNQIPETVMFDVAGRMMGSMTPTVVNVPSSVNIAPNGDRPNGDDSGPTGEPGSEQLNPERTIRQPAGAVPA